MYDGVDRLNYPHPPRPLSPIAEPPSITMAIKLLYATAAFGIVQLIVGITVAVGTLGLAMASGFALLFVTLVFAAINVALYVWMARSTIRGRRWPRVVTVVFTILSVIGLLGSIGQPSPALSVVVSLVSVGLQGSALWFMFREDSSVFYREHEGYR